MIRSRCVTEEEYGPQTRYKRIAYKQPSSNSAAEKLAYGYTRSGCEYPKVGRRARYTLW